MEPPPVAAFPPASFRTDVGTEEWSSYLDTWIFVIQYELRQSSDSFFAYIQKDDSLITFVTSYIHESSESNGDSSSNEPKPRALRREVFILTHRCLLEIDPPPEKLLHRTFLTEFSNVYMKSAALRQLYEKLWILHQDQIEKTLSPVKSSLTKRLESLKGHEDQQLCINLKSLAPLLRVSDGIAGFFMVGSEFVDALTTAYNTKNSLLRKRIAIVSCLGLLSLLHGDKPNISLVVDHLYSMKASAESSEKAKPDAISLLSELATNSPLLQRLRNLQGSDTGRVNGLLASLEKFRKTPGLRPKRNLHKGKGKVLDVKDIGHEGANLHAHRMSLVTQIQDLFPDLGSGFVMKLLEEYSDDVEVVTSHLLEDSLSPHLRDIDRTEEL
jgi:activating signal cointegrator complex subunit 2